MKYTHVCVEMEKHKHLAYLFTEERKASVYDLILYNTCVCVVASILLGCVVCKEILILLRTEVC